MQFNPKLFQHKRGMDASGEQIIVMIVLIIGFAVLFPVTLIAQDSVDVVKDSVCTASIALRSKLDLGILGKGMDIPITCKKKIVNVRGSKEDVMNQFSSQIAACWNLFGEGKLTQTLDLTYAFGIPGKPIDSCFPCAEITVNKLNSDEIITPEELYEFMKFDIIKAENEDSTMNTFDYITKANGIGGRIALLTDIEAHETYQILFSDPAEDFLPKEWGKLNGVYLVKKGQDAYIKDTFGITSAKFAGNKLIDGGDATWTFVGGVGLVVVGILLAPVTLGGSIAITAAGVNRFQNNPKNIATTSGGVRVEWK